MVRSQNLNRSSEDGHRVNALTVVGSSPHLPAHLFVADGSSAANRPAEAQSSIALSTPLCRVPAPLRSGHSHRFLYLMIKYLFADSFDSPSGCQTDKDLSTMVLQQLLELTRFGAVPRL